MNRAKWKEIVLLCLPVVAVLLAAALWQQKEKHDAVLETGPLRLEVEKIEKVTPTPAEVAEGYDTKFLVTFAYRGEGSSSLLRNQSQASKSVSVRKISLLERDEKNWRPVLSAIFPAIRTEGYWESRGISKMQTILLIPLEKLPNKDLQLQLSLTGSSISPSTPILSPTLSVPLRKAGESAPVPEVSRECSLSLQSTKVIPFTPIELNGQGNPSGANRNVQFEVRSKEPGAWRRYLRWKMFNAHIVDENGKIYRKWLGWKMYSPTPARQFRDFTPGQVNRSAEPDGFNIEYSFSTAFIPLSAGRLTFKAQVSVDDEWPLPLSVVVRPKDDWTLKQSRTLKLKSIEAKVASDDKARIDVIVKVNYIGKKPIIAANRHGSSFYSFLDVYHVDDSISKVFREERSPNSRFLISSWSHRIEHSSSPIPSPELRRVNSGYYPVRMKSISSNKNEWEIIYRITSLRLKKLPPPLVFKADIGVEGDGFLPVSVPLPPALVAKTAATPLP